MEVVDKSDPPKTGDEFKYELNMLYDQFMFLSYQKGLDHTGPILDNLYTIFKQK